MKKVWAPYFWTKRDAKDDAGW